MGMAVDIQILLQIRKKALIVPAQAVFQGDKQKIVLVFKGKNQIETRGVEIAPIGPNHQGLVEITKGLQEGEQLLIIGK